MSDKKTFSVAMFGIPETERNVLKNIFKLSLYRANTYALVSAAQASQILMVDAEDPKAMAEWSAFCGAGPDPSSSSSADGKTLRFPTVMVAKETLSNSGPYSVRRPFVATRVLSVLDQVATQVSTDPPQERVIGAEQPKAVEVVEPSSFTALVVDDSSTVRKQIELELKLFGIQVDAVESGEQAFESLARNNYNLIFLDVVLPGIDGYQICKIIKKDKAKKKIPVVMLTSKSSPFDRVKGALAGCDTYLTKPVKQSSFQKVVKKYLKI
ncbi:MAG TPA: response regulator [Candidatus Competibacteraceae bacterium]|nr:MAG: response regulator [Candidatus Competibacteraceae bacterium]HOB62068.1 response regulator [Candidatus Competibacteraceae bacterium]HQA25681.1 response regulator [Candidatus Competibacteraceae bacterium]HQD56672.1 response regulator [Candidatus Competibacteraceae bacterium]